MIKKRGSIAHNEFLTELKEAVSSGTTFTDTHAHIHFSPLADELPDVISRAAKHGVSRIVTIGIDLADSKKAKAVSDKTDNVFFTVGVHPHDAINFDLSQIEEFEKLLSAPKAIAIGEIGLDYYRDHSPHNKQKEIFLTFLDMAVAHNKPVVIHNRDAGKDSIDAMNSVIKGRDRNGIIHCYDGDRDVMRWALDNGFYISYAGPLTYAKNDDLKNTLKYVPLDRLFIETDSPYLTPSPFRGKTNEPANVVYTANEICHLIDITIAKLAIQLEDNYTQLFG